MNVSTDANLAVAGGTIILAFFTWRAAAASRKAAQATEQAASSGREAAEASRQAAEAARDEADATVQLAQEAREDRELAWRPYLVVDVITTVSTGKLTYKVRNIGRGPAIDVTIWAYHPVQGTGTWGYAPACALAAGTSKQGGFQADQTARFPVDLFPKPTNPDRVPGLVVVATCTDIGDNRWRFVDGYRPDQVRPRDPNPPPWTAWVAEPGGLDNPTR
ncbi:hypothetical protein ACFFRE_00210 [Aciditerrimonas ferrireducens]|uniref:Uncharacterized protein n=1 Tax=Aciditerrimonas ferrireducens TaxID=667306 RepID=A0ABV6BYQ2_9ACTN